MDCGDMLDEIILAAKSDAVLAGLYDKMLEYARMYLYIKMRQKGCDGLGELNNLKDEVRAASAEMVAYCEGKHILPEAFSYDLDLMAEELDKMSQQGSC